MTEKIITKSFERLFDKGKHRGFITFDELGKSLGKRNGTIENIEKAFIILVDEKITLVEKNPNINKIRKKKPQVHLKRKAQIKVMIQYECTSERWVGSSFYLEKAK
jgi:hypothetical protein